MTGTELAAEIADLLEEDYALNPIWPQADIHNLVTQVFPMVMKDSGGADLEQLGQSLSTSTGATHAIVSSDTMVGPWFVRSISASYPIIDVMNADFLTGVTDPYASGTPQGCAVEIEYGGGNYDSVLRFFPRFSSTGTTITYWVKDAPETSQTITDTIQARQVFILPIKFKALAAALRMDTEGKDIARADIWNSIADVLIESLRSLYRGGQLP